MTGSEWTGLKGGWIIGGSWLLRRVSVHGEECARPSTYWASIVCVDHETVRCAGGTSGLPIPLVEVRLIVCENTRQSCEAGKAC